MMITINLQGDKKYITGSVNGEPFGVSFDETKYRAMLELQEKAENADTIEKLRAITEEFKALAQESYKDLVEAGSPFIMVNRSTNKFYLKWADKISSVPIAPALKDRIIKSIEKDIPISPLIKCWARWIRVIPGRPAFTEERAQLFAKYIDADYTDDDRVAKLEREHGLSHDVAVAQSTTKQVAITQEGLLCGYKVSTEITQRFIKDPAMPGGVKRTDRYDYNVDENTGDKSYIKPDVVEDMVFEPACMGQGGDAFLCGGVLGHVIRVGEVIELPRWDQVSTPGHKGLHVGGLRYIRGYQQPGTATHNVFIDPMDIHTIGGLGYGSDGAMTVKRYFVHSSFAGANKNIYHSSTYAALTDKEYENLVKEAVEGMQMKAEEAKALQVIGRDTKDGTKPLSSGQVFGK